MSIVLTVTIAAAPASGLFPPRPRPPPNPPRPPPPFAGASITHDLAAHVVRREQRRSCRRPCRRRRRRRSPCDRRCPAAMKSAPAWNVLPPAVIVDALLTDARRDRQILEVRAVVAGGLEAEPPHLALDVRGGANRVGRAGFAAAHGVRGVDVEPRHQVARRDRRDGRAARDRCAAWSAPVTAGHFCCAASAGATHTSARAARVAARVMEDWFTKNLTGSRGTSRVATCDARRRERGAP